MNNSKGNLKERAYSFALTVIKLIDMLQKSDWAVEIISKQLLRSATSVGANIIEAHAGSSRKDFANYYRHALKSANEAKFWIGLLKDSKKADPINCNPIANEVTELASMLAASIITLKTKRI